jgi:hypothetical protein
MFTYQPQESVKLYAPLNGAKWVFVLVCFFLLIWEGEMVIQQGENLTGAEFRHLLPPPS